MTMRKESNQMEASVHESEEASSLQCHVYNPWTNIGFLQLFVKCRQGVKLSTGVNFISAALSSSNNCLCAFYSCVNSLDAGLAWASWRGVLGSRAGDAEIARTDIARPSKLWGLTSRDWTTRDQVARVDITGPDNAAPDQRCTIFMLQPAWNIIWTESISL